MSHALSRFYRGKRVLVTGHTGFAGGWAAAWLKLLGAQVYGYGLPPATRPNFFDATSLDRGMTSVFADVRDRSALSNAFAEFQPEIVLHCASRSNPHLAHREPVETFSTNLMGTVLLLEEARHTGSVKSVVNVSCDAPSNSQDLPTEASSKDIHHYCMSCVEMAGSAYAGAFFRARNSFVATARCSEAIGGGDWREGRILPNLVRSLMYGEPVDPGNAPKFQVWHVLEAVHGLLLLAQKLFDGGEEYCRRWDFASSSAPSVAPAEFAKFFVELWDAMEPGATPAGALHAGSRAVTPNFPAIGPPLGWSNVLDDRQAVLWTVEWYRAYYADSSAAWRTTDEQIERYMQLTMA